MMAMAIAGWLFLAVIAMATTIDVSRGLRSRMTIELRIGRDGKRELRVDGRTSRILRSLLTRADPQGVEEYGDLRVIVLDEPHERRDAPPPHRPIEDPTTKRNG